MIDGNHARLERDGSLVVYWAGSAAVRLRVPPGWRGTRPARGAPLAARAVKRWELNSVASVNSNNRTTVWGSPTTVANVRGRLNNNKEGLAVTHDDLQRPVRVIPENTRKPPGISGFTRFFAVFCLLHAGR